MAGEPIRARPVSPPERLRRWCWRNPGLAALAGLALDALEQAVAKGYRDAGNLETDPDLDAVRDQPRVKALVARLRAAP